MRNGQLFGLAFGRGQAKTITGFGTDKMFHGHGFSGPEQAAVKYRVGFKVCQIAAVAHWHIKTPGFNTPVPAGEGKGVIRRPISHGMGIRNTDRHKISAHAIAFAIILAFDGFA